MKELGASNMEGAAKPLNPVIPTSLQPAQMPTGDAHWIGELVEKWWSVIGKRKKTLHDRSFRSTWMKNLKKHVQVFVNVFYWIIFYWWMKIWELFEAALFSVSFATSYQFIMKVIFQSSKNCCIPQRYKFLPNFCAWQKCPSLFSFNVWALCPTGYYWNGLSMSRGLPGYLNDINDAQCCHPQNHPNSYEHCYDEDVSSSFDHAGWSECKQPGYYMTGFYKSSCNQINCIEKFRCCKMKKRNFLFCLL